MRVGLLLIAIALWAGCLSIFIFWFLPREQSVVVSQLVPEQQTKTMQLTFKLGTETALLEVPMTYTVHKPVYETKTREPSRDEWLRFVCLSVIASLVFFYCFIVIAAFAKHLWAGGALPKAVEIQLAGTITFLLGALGGALAVPPPSPQGDNWKNWQPPSTQAQDQATPSIGERVVFPPASGPAVSAPRPVLDPAERVGPPETYRPSSPE